MGPSQLGSPVGMSTGSQSAVSLASEQPAPEQILGSEDVEAIDDMNNTVPDLLLAPLAGSFKEGKIRFIMDVAETLLDRPAGVYDVARGQCRSSSGSPRRRRTTSRRTKSSTMTLSSIQEDELGDDVPTTHALFLPASDQLPSAPFPTLGKSGPPDAFTATFIEDAENAIESLLRPETAGSRCKWKPKQEDWLRPRSVPRVRYGRHTVRAIRISDPKVGFGRRSSLRQAARSCLGSAGNQVQ